MSEKNFINSYDDGNIPDVDLPQHNSTSSDSFISLTDFLNSVKTTGSNENSNRSTAIVEPLPESTRPRQDGPGGN